MPRYRETHEEPPPEDERRRKRRPLEVIEQTSDGTLPTQVSWHVSNSGYTDRQLERAARKLARALDIPPVFIFGRKTWNQQIDPALDAGLSLSTVRRLAQKGEVQYFEALLQQFPGIVPRGPRPARQAVVNPRRVARVVQQLGPLDGWNIPAPEALGAAYAVAESGVKIGAWKENLARLYDFFSRSGLLARPIDIDHPDRGSYDWRYLMGMATVSAGAGVTFGSWADVLNFFLPGEAKQLAERRRLESTEAGREYIRRTQAIGQQQALRPGEEATNVLYAGLIPGDFGKALLEGHGADLEKFQGDALTYAQEIERQVTLDQQQFENGWFNKVIVKPITYTLDRLNRPFEMAALGLKGKVDAEIAGIVGLVGMDEQKAAADAVAGNVTEDIVRAWHGEMGLADAMNRDYGTPYWAGYLTELGLGWFTDPLIVGGRAISARRALRVSPRLLESVRGGDVTLGETERGINYLERVSKFAEGNADSLSRAIYSADEGAVVKWSRRWITNYEPRSPWDPTYLEMLRAGVRRQFPEMTKEAIAEVKDAMIAHFVVQAPPGSVAQEVLRGRIALDLAAQKAMAAAPEQLDLWQDARRVIDEVHGEALVGEGDFLLPARFEIPTKLRPIPGLGGFKLAGQAVAESEALGTVGRRLTALTNITPGTLFKYHEDPEVWFRRTGRRMRLPEDRVIALEREAAAAGAPGTIARERRLDELVDGMYNEYLDGIIKPLGVSRQTAEDILADMNGAARGINRSLTFGAWQEGEIGGWRGISRPLGVAQLRNERAVLDPIQIRKLINEWVGATRRMRNSFLSYVGMEAPELTRASRLLPLSHFLDRTWKPFGKVLMRIWKMGAVARPAYIFRVVLGDELLRSLATTESVYERIMAQDLRILGKTGKELRTVRYHIGDEIVERPILGAIEREPLADTYWSYKQLNEDLVNVAIRKERSLAASYNWGMVAPTSRQHSAAWLRALNRDIHFSPGLRYGAEQIATGEIRTSVDTLTERLAAWARTPDGRVEMATLGFKPSQVDEWADAAARMVYGYTMGDPTLARLAALGSVDPELLTKIPRELRPPVHGPLLERMSKGSSFDRFAERWYGWFVRGPESALNRQPYYRIWKGRAEQTYLGALAEAGIKPTDDIIRAVDTASMKFGVAQNKRIMFDFTEQSRMGELLGFAVPFSQPFMENIAVWGHIITRQHPELIGYVNRITRAGLASGFVHRDPDTNELVIPETWFAFTVPLLWALGGPATKGRWTLSTRLSSLNLFVASTMKIQGIPIPVPSLAPWIQVPLAKWLGDKDIPVWLSSYLFQFGPQEETLPRALTESFLPRWLQNGLAALNPEWFAPEKYKSLQADFIRMQAATGQKPDAARAEAQAKWFFGYSVLTSALFPGAPIVNFPHDEMQRDWNDRAEQAIKGEITWDEARDSFIADYGRDNPYISILTIGKTATARIAPGVPGIRTEPSALAQALITSPGFKEFANDPKTAMWAAALMIQSNNPKAHEFDGDAFAQQVSSGRVYYRTAKEIIAADEDIQAWASYRALDEYYDSQFDKLQARGLDAQNQEWKTLADQRAEEIGGFRESYPGWFDRYVVPRQTGEGYELVYDSAEQGPEGVNKLILTSAQAVLESDVVKGLPAVEGLRGYMNFRKTIIGSLSKGGWSSLESPGAEGVKKEYEQGVEVLIGQYPEFEIFYNTWFSRDLSYGVQTSGQKRIDKWRKAGDPRGEAYIDFDTRLEQFGEKIKDARATGEDADVTALYLRERRFIDAQWRKYGAGFVQTYFDEMTYSERQSYLATLRLRPPEFYSRLDWSLMGVKLTNQASDWLNGVSEANAQISAFSQENPDETTGDKHEAVAKWIKEHMGKDKSFDAAVAAMNTWGWQAEAAGYTTQPGRSGKAWGALLEFANGIRSAVERLAIHGDDKRVEFDPENRKTYSQARDVLLDYVRELRAWSNGFENQWDEMAARNDEPLIYWLMPPVHFRITGD